MYVAEGACKTLIKERQEEFFDTYVRAMMNEAEKLGLTKEDIVEMIERGNTK